MYALTKENLITKTSQFSKIRSDKSPFGKQSGACVIKLITAIINGHMPVKNICQFYKNFDNGHLAVLQVIWPYYGHMTVVWRFNYCHMTILY